MLYLRVTGELYDVITLENSENVVAKDLKSGASYLFSLDELTVKVQTEEGEKPLFTPINTKMPLKAFSSKDLIDELVVRGEVPEGAEIKSNDIIEENYKICRKVAPDVYNHLMKPNTFTESYSKAVESLSFYRSTEPSPENLYIICTRSTVLKD